MADSDTTIDSYFSSSDDSTEDISDESSYLSDDSTDDESLINYVTDENRATAGVMMRDFCTS